MAQDGAGALKLTQTVNADGSLFSVWKNADGSLKCTSVIMNRAGGGPTSTSQCYENGALSYTNTYTTSSDGSSTSTLTYASGPQKDQTVTIVTNADGTQRQSTAPTPAPPSLTTRIQVPSFAIQVTGS